MSNLAFRILSHEIYGADDQEFGITYHHVRVRRGKDSYDIGRVVLAVPHGCTPVGMSGGVEAWSVQPFGANVPWDLDALRVRAKKMAISSGSPSGDHCSFRTFLLVDRREHLAKVLSDAEPGLLIDFYRSLEDPGDGLVVADSRASNAIKKAFKSSSAFVVPATVYTVCTASNSAGGPKYSVHQGLSCSSSGWQKISGGVFLARGKALPGMQAVSWCVNKKYWHQHVVASESCPLEWASLKWTHGGTLWVPKGTSYCVGTRETTRPEQTFSRILAKKNCGGEGFQHDFGFDAVEAEFSTTSMTLCVGVSAERALRVSRHQGYCSQGGGRTLLRFPVWPAGDGDSKNVGQTYCVVERDGVGDVILEAGQCGDAEKFAFTLPSYASIGEAADAMHNRQSVCWPTDTTRKPAVGKGCEGTGVRLEVPSIADIAASTPRGGAEGSTPLYTLIEEEVPCFSFLCPRPSNT